MKNFWKDLKKPIFVMAPMDEVTDFVFREVLLKTQKPDVFFTEFTNVDGLQSQGREALLPRLKFSRAQRPIVAQIWGLNPENFYKTAKELVEMGFDGIDINMGCPDRGITKHGCCAGLINNPALAAEIIEATKKGADGKIPVSVKTRIGFNKIITEEWCGFLLKQGIDVLIVHGRTKSEMSKVEAHWDEIEKVVKLRNLMKLETLIIGNGDVKDKEDGFKKVKETKVDGVMIGRGIFYDLWAFADKDKKPSLNEKEMLKLLLDHARLFIKTWGDKKHFLILRKFFKVYVRDFKDASKLRMDLMESKDLKDVEAIVARSL